MENELDLYTGKVKFDGKTYNFVFDKKVLRLLAHEEGSFEQFNNPWEIPRVNCSYLYGECSETGKPLIFFTNPRDFIGSINGVRSIKIQAYIIQKRQIETLIDRMRFESTEIDCIFDNRKALDKTYCDVDSGTFGVFTKNFNETTSGKEKFKVNGVEVTVYFGISRSVNNAIGKPPLTLHSTMIFEFEPTSDYEFIYRLWGIAKQFIQYLCYRTNCNIPSIVLATPKSGKHLDFATMNIISEQKKESELESLKNNCYIKQDHIEGYEGKILSDIANGILYLRHLPDSSEAGKGINEARFIMLTAAFEWEFNRTHPEGISRKKSSVDAENQVASYIKEQIKNNTGKIKDIFKRLENDIQLDSFQSKIVEIEKEYSAVLNVFSDHLYS
ncbi:MAG: hypothetical protein ACRC76_14625, partial [Proteocatella sp.]